jgi:hypothetical protein
MDHSTQTLIDSATAKAMLADTIPAKTWKLYSPRTYGFVSQVDGGFNKGGICVVTATVSMMQLSATRAMLFKPKETATAFDALPGATPEQCKDLAKAKLKEAIEGVTHE